MKKFHINLKNYLLRIRFILIPAASRREEWYYEFRYILLHRHLGFKNFIHKIFLISTIQITNLITKKQVSTEELHYQIWIKEHEPHKKKQNWQLKTNSWAITPEFCFLIPIANENYKLLEKTIQSIFSQTYPNWNLYLLLLGGNELKENLEQGVINDSRLHLIYLSGDPQDSFDFNQLVGDYVMIVRNGDTISKYLLHDVIQLFQKDSNIDLVYFDEDKYDIESGKRFSPWFKPSGWSPDLLLSVNYLRHAVIRKKCFVDLDPIPFPLSEMHEWDLMLRLAEKSPHLVHIPRILYHEGLNGHLAKGEQLLVDLNWMEKAIHEHLHRVGFKDTIVQFNNSIVRIRYPISSEMVSIIIPTKNNLSYLRNCISSILEKTTYTNFEILLIDNNSDQPELVSYYKTLVNEKRIRLLSYPYPFNFHKLNNWAASQAFGDILLFLNNDTEVIEPSWLEEMAGCALRSEVGVVGAKLLRPNGKIQHVGMIVGLMGHAGDIFEDCEDHTNTCFGSVDWYRNYQALTGACMAIRREVFNLLGGFDEKYIVGYGDIDLCLRARKLGYWIIYTPFAVLKHYEGGTRKYWLPRSDVLRATLKMWSEVEKGDEFYNPNLSYHSRIPSLMSQFEESRLGRLLRILKEYRLVEEGATLDLPIISLPNDENISYPNCLP